ncbi:acyl-CoA N-acyltransferase [Xylaria arbuscula]|nr:acyl-CoA N-acyltransferase [Xylaria arbuscula]
MATTSFLSNNFRSERLIYLVAEDNLEIKEFLNTHISDNALSRALADIGVIRPLGNKYAQSTIDALIKAELGVIIYLPGSKPKPIGYLGLGWGGKSATTAHHRTTSIGLVLADPYQNQGYGGEAINWALDWAFRLGGYHRVEIGTVSFNERAIHLYKRLGFVEEGRSRESFWFDRKWHDRLSFGILESEWAALRGVKI